MLRLPLSFFTDARKGDVMTRISNDVQEIEVSVMSSLNMLFRDPMYILIYVVYLIVSSFQLTLFALVLLAYKRMAYRQGKPYITVIFTGQPAISWQAAFCC